MREEYLNLIRRMLDSLSENEIEVIYDFIHHLFVEAQ